MLNVPAIKQRAKEVRITLKQLADAIGMSEGGFHTALANSSLKLNAIEKLALVLKLDLHEIIVFEHSAPTTAYQLSSQESLLKGSEPNLTMTTIEHLEHDNELLRLKLEAANVIIIGQEAHIADLRALVDLLRGRQGVSSDDQKLK